MTSAAFKRSASTDEDVITPVAEAGLLAQDALRAVQRTGDASIAFDWLLHLTDRFGVNSRPVAAYVTGLVKR